MWDSGHQRNGTYDVGCFAVKFQGVKIKNNFMETPRTDLIMGMFCPLRLKKLSFHPQARG